MSARTYGQYCGLARALELVGDRWALLIVRDLLVGPRRFTELEAGLPSISTSVLAARLKGLEEDGIVRREIPPRPESGFRYALTPFGCELEEAALALGRWGARALGEPREGEVVTAESMVMSLRTLFRPEAARGLDARFQLRLGEVVVHARVKAGGLEAAPGPAPSPDLSIEAGPRLRALLAGEITAEEAVEEGAVRIHGDESLLRRYVEIFPI